MPRSTRTAARHGAYKLENLLGALTKLVPILLGGARTTSRQASLERRSRFAARTESELLGIIFEQLEAVAAETLGGPPY